MVNTLMVYLLALLFKVFSYGSVKFESNRPKTTSKRMVWGKALLDIDSYDSVGYHVYLANGHRCNKLVVQLKQIFGHYSVCPPDPNHLICGGSLIMPNVVQTCCHCLAIFSFINDTYAVTRVRNGWEDWMAAFHGYTKVDDMVDEGTWSKKFWVHPNCAEIMGYSLTYDFGLILLNQPFVFRRPHLKLAPVYTEKSLIKQYRDSINRQSVCLFIGFGLYTWGLGEPGSSSPVLMHGWRLLSSYNFCFTEILSVHRGNMEYFGYRYADKATWACHIFFGKERAHILQGDSGSPVTCSNEYFGMNSFLTFIDVRNYSVEMAAAIVFVANHNTVEYRKSLMTVILEQYEMDEKLAPTFRPDFESYYKDKMKELETDQNSKLFFNPLSGSPSRLINKSVLLTVCVILKYIVAIQLF